MIEVGDQREVTQLDQVARDLEVDVVLADLVAQDLDAPARALEALVGAHDADVRPHEAADLVPVQRHDDRVVGVGRVRRTTTARRARGGSRGASRTAVGGARREHHAFEQRVRREAIRAVQAGERALADRVEALDRRARRDRRS